MEQQQLQKQMQQMQQIHEQQWKEMQQRQWQQQQDQFYDEKRKQVLQKEQEQMQMQGEYMQTREYHFQVINPVADAEEEEEIIVRTPSRRILY